MPARPSARRRSVLIATLLAIVGLMLPATPAAPSSGNPAWRSPRAMLPLGATVHTGLLFEITDPPVQTELLLVQTDEDQPVSVDVRSVVTPVLEGSVVISFSRISGPSYGVLSPVEPGWWTYTPIPEMAASLRPGGVMDDSPGHG